MKLGLIDKFLNGILKTVIKMQRTVIKTERFIDKFGLLIAAVLFILIFLSGCFKLDVLLILCSVLFCFFVMISLSLGWHSSIRKFAIFITFYLFYMLLFIGLVTSQIMSISRFEQLFPFLMVIYFLSWIFLSLVARPDVAKLANEILSAFITIVFTVGTYTMGFVLPKHLPLEVFDSTYKSVEALEQAMLQDQQVGEVVLQSSIYWAMERLFLYLLPFICITIISMTAINIKQYWTKKHPEFIEIWDANQAADEVHEELDE